MKKEENRRVAGRDAFVLLFWLRSRLRVGKCSRVQLNRAKSDAEKLSWDQAPNPHRFGVVIDGRSNKFFRLLELFHPLLSKIAGR